MTGFFLLFRLPAQSGPLSPSPGTPFVFLALAVLYNYPLGYVFADYFLLLGYQLPEGRPQLCTAHPGTPRA